MIRRTSLKILFVTTICSAAFAQPSQDEGATFFVGRATFHTNKGTCCGDVGLELAQLVAQISTIPVKGQEKVAIGSDDIFQTPFLFMNSHDDFVYSDVELSNLRTYLQHGGFLFASGCCTNPAFPKAWRREMDRVFPSEKVRPLGYDHPIYKAFYRIERIRNLHENREVHLECLFLDGRMVAVMCENGLCCAFARNNRCNVGRGVSPEDGKKLALNIAVYAMTH
ncbi:MAG: DUF4159 domain-containing protein [Planctomycetes bacterium]|nr:DUF4159 domain-containing protein [Planctomycetota bacterium]